MGKRLGSKSKQNDRPVVELHHDSFSSRYNDYPACKDSGQGASVITPPEGTSSETTANHKNQDVKDVETQYWELEVLLLAD